MSEYEVRVSTNVDTSELDAAQKKLDNLVKNDKQLKVDFNIDGMNNLNKINGMFKNIEKSFGSAGKIAGQNFNKGFENTQNKSGSNKFSGIDKELEKLKKGLSTFKYDSASAKMESQLNKYAKQSGNKMLEEARAAKKIYDDSLKSIKELSSKGKLDFNDVNVQNTFSDLTRSSEKFKNAMSAVNSELSKTISVSEAHSAANKTLSWLQANTKAADKYGDQLEELANKQRNALTAGDSKEYTSQVRAIQSAASAEGLTGMSKIAELKRAVTQISEFVGVYGVLQNVVMDGSRKMVQNVIDVNDVMTDLRMATSLSNDEAYKMMDTYYELGDKLKATGSDIAKSSTEWLKQGKAIQEASKLTEDSIILSKIGDLSPENATKTITAAMKSYKMSEDQVMGFVDQISAIDMASATDVGGLATAFNEVAANAKTAGLETKNLLSYAAAIGETTQEGMASVGTSLNAIFSRMGNIKLSRLKDYETGEDLSNVETVLRGVGISLRDTQDEFKDFDVVLSETAEGWTRFSGVQKRAVAQAFAGTNHMNEFMVLMEQWDNVEKYIDIANNASGESMKKYEAYQDSISGKIEGFNNKVQSLSTSLISSDVFGFLVDSGSSLIGVLDTILNKFGSFSSLLGLLSGTVLSKNGLGNDNIVEFAHFYKIA